MGIKYILNNNFETNKSYATVAQRANPIGDKNQPDNYLALDKKLSNTKRLIKVSGAAKNLIFNRNLPNRTFAQSAGTVEYNECPGYDTRQSDGEVPVMLELWGMRSTPLLPSLPGSL